MLRKIFLTLLVGLLTLGGLTVNSHPAEKLQLGSSIRLYPAFYLPILAAEERGFFKKNGLEVEWVPFRGGTTLARAMAAGAINIGLSTASSDIVAISRGVPIQIVAQLFRGSKDWFIWVRRDSPLKKPQDLKGAKVGVTRLGGASYGYARAIARSQGLEKEVRIVATGGIREQVAALKTGAVDATLVSIYIVASMKLKGEVRELLSLGDILPREWADQEVIARRDFVQKNPDTVRRVVKSLLQGVDFLRKNPPWTIEKMRSMSRFSEEAARMVYQGYLLRNLTVDGRTSRKGVENVREFLMEFDIMSRDKAPRLTIFIPTSS